VAILLYRDTILLVGICQYSYRYKLEINIMGQEWTLCSEGNDSLFCFYSGLEKRQIHLNLLYFKYRKEHMITAGAYVVSPVATPVIYEVVSPISYPSPGYTTAMDTTSRQARRYRPR
jgi:hypothetical protein